MTYCCKEFKEKATHLDGGIIPGRYPLSVFPKAQFERDQDGTWVVRGCCGGGCNVIIGMKFCPYCGADLTKEAKG